MTMWGNMRSDFGKGMNVPVTAAEECSHSFFSPALRLVFPVVVCCPLSPLSSSSLSRALFDCCVCFCHRCHCGCRPNLTPHRRQAAAAAVLQPSCRGGWFVGGCCRCQRVATARRCISLKIDALRSAASSARNDAMAKEGHVNYDVSDVSVKARAAPTTGVAVTVG